MGLFKNKKNYVFYEAASKYLVYINQGTKFFLKIFRKSFEKVRKNEIFRKFRKLKKAKKSKHFQKISKNFQKNFKKFSKKFEKVLKNYRETSKFFGQSNNEL